MTLLVASLYLLCLAFLLGAALAVYSRDPDSRLNASFAGLCLILLAWVGTLFVFNAETNPVRLLWLGRANFAAAILVAPAVLGFVTELAKRRSSLVSFAWRTGILLAGAALFTSWIDRSENVVLGQHITAYGWLFWPYIVVIVGVLTTAIIEAFRPEYDLAVQTRSQLRLVGVGILASAIISIITDAVLPSVRGNFRFIHVGTLSTILFLAAVAYAVYVHHLFNIRVILRTAAIYTVLIAFALELYQAAVEFLAHLVPLGDPVQQRVAAATIVFIINAISHEPIRKVLEQTVDHLLSRRAFARRSLRRIR